MDNKRNWNNEPRKLAYKYDNQGEDKEFFCPACHGEWFKRMEGFTRCVDCGQPIKGVLYFINCNKLTS